MLNLADIRVEIDRLEKGNTSYDTCEKLACLYTILEHHKDAPTILSANDNVVKEYSEILPSYSIYCSKKRMYQLHQLDKESVIESLLDTLKEISEFLSTLYNSTDMEEERNLIKAELSKDFF